MSTHDDSLASLLLREGAALSRRVVGDMYASNPFWDARFGARGRTFAEEDAGRHVEHLVVALHAENPAVFVEFARWLQRVLTTRGMCTRHVAENFARLAAALDATAWPGVERASAIVRQGARALAYESGPAAEVDRARASLGEAITRRLEAEHPDWFTGERQRARCRDDVDYHLSYLADALANERPEAFASYVQFVRGFLARFAVPEAHVDATLAALHDEVAACTPAARDAARAVLAFRVTA